MFAAAIMNWLTVTEHIHGHKWPLICSICGNNISNYTFVVYDLSPNTNFNFVTSGDLNISKHLVSWCSESYPFEAATMLYVDKRFTPLRSNMLLKNDIDVNEHEKHVSFLSINKKITRFQISRIYLLHFCMV